MRWGGAFVVSIVLLMPFTACGGSPPAAPVGTVATKAPSISAPTVDSAMGPCDVMREAQQQTLAMGPGFLDAVAKLSLDSSVKLAEVAPPEIKKESDLIVAYYVEAYREHKAGRQPREMNAEENAAEEAQEAWARANCPDLEFS